MDTSAEKVHQWTVSAAVACITAAARPQQPGPVSHDGRGCPSAQPICNASRMIDTCAQSTVQCISLPHLIMAVTHGPQNALGSAQGTVSFAALALNFTSMAAGRSKGSTVAVVQKCVHNASRHEPRDSTSAAVT
jgi:hypothetical protein